MEDSLTLHNVTLAEINCGECGGVYAISERFRNHKLTNGGFWNCPYCKTSWGYGESENDKLKKERDRQKKIAEKERKKREWAEQEAQNAEKRLSAQKGVTTKLKNRAKAGACPCCNRTFKQLAAHMKNKHPEFAKDKK